MEHLETDGRGRKGQSRRRGGGREKRGGCLLPAAAAVLLLAVLAAGIWLLAGPGREPELARETPAEIHRETMAPAEWETKEEARAPEEGGGNRTPEEILAEIIGEDRVYGGVCAWGANLVGDGMAELTSDPAGMSIEIGSYSGRCDKLKELREILSAVGEISGNPSFVTVTDNLEGARWSKLAINAAFSGLSVVTGLTFGEIAKRRRSRKIALGILRECFAVASELGVKLEKIQGHDMEKLLGEPGFFGTQKAMFLLPIAMRRHKRLVSGMLLDLERGRKCEIDYIDGAVCALGDRCSVETPLCDKVVETVHGIENGLYEISEKNLDFFC